MLSPFDLDVWGPSGANPPVESLAYGMGAVSSLDLDTLNP